MLTCDRCGTENSDDARFCNRCGSALAAAEGSLEERKLVSVLFVDLVGSTAAADGADPEDIRDRLKRYFERVREQVDRFDGTVEKFIGDAVVAVFGAPRAHGDDAVRAVRCGLEVALAIDRLNAEEGSALQVRAAVCTGEAVVTLGSAHERGEALVTGDVVNVAARLQSVAPPGRIVVGAETYRATRRAIRYEPMLPVDAKGKRQPVEAFLAVEPEAEPEPSPLPIVGRGRELEQLTSLWARVWEERRPHLVTVLGPPGIGKTRLGAEFASIVEGGGGRAIRGRCLSYEEQTGYRASAEMLKGLAGILESDPPAIARSKLAALADELLPPDEAVDIARYLSLLLGLGTDDPTDDRLPLFFAMRRVLEVIAQDRPTVVMLEDVHWAGSTQLDLLEYLASHVRDVPVLFLALARPELMEQRPSWGGGMIAQTTMPLQPVTAKAAAEIARGMLGDDPVGIDRLVQAAEGNPLFIEELAASVAEGTRADALPSTVREAIASRVDLLPEDERTVLMDASVIGKTFWRGVLAAIREIGNVDACLDALEARDLIRRAARSRVEGDREFSFKHILIREVAYATIPRASRRERHAAVARHFEEAAPESAGELAGLLAHHWREAGEPDKAVDYLMRAASRARESWARDESVALYDEALDLVGDRDPATRLRIRLARGLALADLSEFRPSADELEAILPELDQRNELEALVSLASSMQWLEDSERANASGDRAVEIAEQLGEPELLGPALAAQSGARITIGALEESFSIAARASDVWVEGTRPADLATLHEYQSQVEFWIGNYARAEELARGAYELGGELRHVEPLLRGGGWQALSLTAMGRTEEAIALSDTIIRRSEEIGNPRWGAAPLNYSSMAFRDVFMLEEARRRNEASLELVEQVGEWGMPRMQASIDLMLTDLLEGEVGRAQRTWPAVWDAAINGKVWRPWLGGCRLALVRALIAREAEGPEEASERARDAIARALAVPRPKYEAEARAVLGWALVSMGKAEGVDELRTAVTIADRLGSPTPRWRIRADLGAALAATGDDEGAETTYGEARDVIRTYASTLAPERSASFLAAEPVVAMLKHGG